MYRISHKVPQVCKHSCIDTSWLRLAREDRLQLAMTNSLDPLSTRYIPKDHIPQFHGSTEGPGVGGILGI